MAREQTYEARVMPEAGAALPLASPDTFGAGVGRALEGVGQTLHQTKLRAYELDRKEAAEREGADFLHKFAAQRQANDATLLELQNSANPGGAGHTETVRQMLEAQREQLTSGISEDSVRRQALAQFDSYQTGTLDHEGTWANGQAVAKKVTDFVAAGQISNNRIRLSGGDPQIYLAEQQQQIAQLDTLDVPPDVRDKIREERIKQGGAVALHQGLQDTNPRMGLALLDSGTFNDRLTVEQTDALRSGYMAEIRRQDALAQQQVAHDKSALNEEKATVQADAARGIDVTERAAALVPKLEAVADPSGASQMKGLVEQSVYAKAYNGMTPLQRQAEMADLLKVLPEKRTTQQQTALKWLQDHQGPLDADFKSDPVDWAMKNAPAGAKPPPLEGPGGFAERERWWKAQTYGPNIDLFTKAEAGIYAQMASKDDAGYRQVADELATKFSVSAAQKAAAQILPTDPYLGYVIALQPQKRSDAFDGRAYRKQFPKALDMANERDKLEVMQLTTGLQNAMGPYASQAKKNAAIEVARDLAGFNVSKGKPMGPELWRQVQSMALGGSKRGEQWVGGLGSWNNKTFWVPDDLTQQQFANQVFAKIQKDPNHGPLNGDGSSAFIQNARPVAVTPGVYEFHIEGPGGTKTVMTRGKDGRINIPYRHVVTPP